MVPGDVHCLEILHAVDFASGLDRDVLQIWGKNLDDTDCSLEDSDVGSFECGAEVVGLVVGRR